MDDTLNDLLTRLEHEWAPQLLRTAAGVAFWDGLGWIIVGVVLLILAIIATRIAVVQWFALKKADADGEDEDIPAFTMLGAGSVAAFLAIPSLIILLNIWNWVALFNPELAVAKRIFDAVLKASGS